MNLTFNQKILSGYLFILVIYWLVLKQSGLQTHFWNHFYSFAFSQIPLLGGIFGIYISKHWGMLHSAIGKALFYISAGLFSWGVGSMVWSYYNFFEGIEAPYPSLADVGFLLALPLCTIGMINLSKATGARFALRNLKGRLFLILLPIILIVISYYLLIVIARQNVISENYDDLVKLFFDFAYPVADVIILSLSTVIFGLSFKYFGGIYKWSIICILAGFTVMYFADFVFSYTTTAGTFYNGNFGDLLFTIALFLMTFGIFGFSNPMRIKD